MPVSVEEWDTLSAQHDERFRRSELLPGVQELLHNLSHRVNPPVCMGLASTSSRSLFEIKTSHLPSIRDTFPAQFCVFVDDITAAGMQGKPAPDVFLLVLQHINSTLEEEGMREDIQPRECLVFEDSIAGVEAARQAGMRVVWVPHPGLLAVCEGWIDEVLQGTTERVGEEVGPLFPRSDPCSVGRQHGDSCVSKSEDGWAECITSLLQFRYDRYGIHLNP